MMQVFLIGGGGNAEAFPQTYGRFLQAATANNQKKIAVIVAEEDGADSHEQFLRFSSAFESVGLNSADSVEVIVSPEKPLTIKNLNEIRPSGIFVCGGLTPAYHDSLCLDKHWLKHLFENKIPYCGFSAGASIASEKAIIGGWRREINDQVIAVTNENAGEDLDLLDVRDGLGLVPFAVDVHATQWGTLSRLVHTVNAEFVIEGWAIDENTMLEFDGKNVFVRGAGSAYQIRRAANHSIIDIFYSGKQILIR